MPASYLHQCVVADTVGLSPAALAGGEGPDIFFYTLRKDAKGTPLPHLGNAMHATAPGEFLFALLSRAATPDAQAYALGFLCHYATDTVFHPFVYAHALRGDNSFSSNRHCTLEHRLDALLYQQRTGKTDTPRHMEGFRLLEGESRRDIAAPLSDALAAVYPDFRVPAALCLRAFGDCVRLADLLHSPGGTKYALFGALAAPFGLRNLVHAHMVPRTLPKEDFANEAHAPWVSPFDTAKRVHTQSACDLYAQACLRAADYIRAARAYWAGTLGAEELRATLGSNSYHSGLPWDAPDARSGS